MNERIQALADEAEDYADGIVDQGGEFHPAYTQKLAELIIRECAEICKKQSFHYAKHYNKGSAASAADVCRILINHHFGVKS